MGLEIDELSTLDATAHAELVRRRELTPLELVDAAIARIERVNSTINAVITPLFEEAWKIGVSPDLPNGPFRGVPFLLKDIGAMQKGQPYYAGNPALRDAGFRSPFDTPLGARFRAVGFITLGKTNLPEFGQQTTSLCRGVCSRKSASTRSSLSLKPESVSSEIKVIEEFDGFLDCDEKERAFWTARSTIAAYD